jgi:molybdopterin synthase sulfur carrier subunit
VAADVYLPSSLTVLFPGAPRKLALEAGTVGEVIDLLDARWPGIRHRLCDGGQIRQYVHVYVDGERATLATAVGAAAKIHVIPAMAGGVTA